MPIKVSDDLVLYDVEELARLFGLSEKSVRGLLKTGKLRGKKMARKWYTSEAELKAYFRQPGPADGLESEQERQDEPAERL
jgi:hypothetical protein